MTAHAITVRFDPDWLAWQAWCDQCQLVARADSRDGAIRDSADHAEHRAFIAELDAATADRRFHP